MVTVPGGWCWWPLHFWLYYTVRSDSLFRLNFAPWKTNGWFSVAFLLTGFIVFLLPLALSSSSTITMSCIHRSSKVIHQGPERGSFTFYTLSTFNIFSPQRSWAVLPGGNATVSHLFQMSKGSLLWLFFFLRISMWLICLHSGTHWPVTHPSTLIIN